MGANMESNIVMSGSIISELSEKIPSDIIALNELIKNSYDACACKVTVNINTEEKSIVVQDDGCGMNENEIDSLLKIGRSTKKFGGVSDCGRYVQGSKGLGFLAAFKFGEEVTWFTFRDEGIRFSLNLSELRALEDISNYKVPLLGDNSIDKGTRIEIKVSEYHINSLGNYFSNPSNREKILNSFLDDTFDIELIIDGNEILSSKGELESYLPISKELFRVSYSSESNEIIYKFDNQEVHKEEYDFVYTRFRVELDLMIFHLAKNDSRNVCSLYYNPQELLTPLLYVNNNLFNNYTLFSPDIARRIASSVALPQMIGYVKLFCDDEQMGFNSDRSQFLQNELTDSIVRFLAKMNIDIQRIGSKRKAMLADVEYLSSHEIRKSVLIADGTNLSNYIKDDFSYKKAITIATTTDEIVFTLYGKKKRMHVVNDDNNGEDAPLQPADIKLRGTDLTISIPSEQINLADYIVSAYNSQGESVDKEEIRIEVDGVFYENQILESVEQVCEKTVIFKYNDALTNELIKQLVLSFEQSVEPLQGVTTPEALLALPTQPTYRIIFSNVLVSLIRQINDLNCESNKEVIACSLRALFDISIQEIRNCGKYPNLPYGSGLAALVEATIDHLNTITGVARIIDQNTLLGRNSLRSILGDSGRFTAAVRNAHLGAHGSTMHLDSEDLKNIANKASYFIVFANEMITNQNIT